MVLDLWRDSRTAPRSFLEDFWGVLENIERGHTDRSYQTRALVPACDVSETPDSFLLSFDMPGLKKEDISIEVNGRHLIVSGERKRESASETNGNYRVERSFGKFSRTFDLPENANFENIAADYENGELKIAIPKAERGKARKIEIGDANKGFLKRITEKKEAKVS